MYFRTKNYINGKKILSIALLSFFGLANLNAQNQNYLMDTSFGT